MRREPHAYESACGCWECFKQAPPEAFEGVAHQPALNRLTAAEQRAVNAFAALLAVAKAAHADHTFQADSKRSPLADLDRALRTLDAAHPGWREWP